MKHDLPPLTLPAASRRAALYALGALGTLGVVGAALLAPARVAAQTLEAPDALIMRVGLEVLRPSRFTPQDTEVVVRTELRGRSEPIQIDYRLERTPQGWKVFDFNVMGIWLVDTYRNQFTTEINARGIDGLIAALTERNRAGAAAART
ncbi:MAG: hypothetical protein B7X56_05520 [Burkholderiales bacterium 34-67-9]|nr:MAG: hypothetical protein B7X56_05520 [Burkholderiales bacterium 34-67-9]